jgi:hypothetical protein
MGRHLATVLDEYGDIWGMSDKELAFAFDIIGRNWRDEKYYTQGDETPDELAQGHTRTDLDAL